MKRLALIAAFLPGLVLAHGTHAPVPEIAHGFAHAGPLAGLALIAIAVAAGWLAVRRRH